MRRAVTFTLLATVLLVSCVSAPPNRVDIILLVPGKLSNTIQMGTIVSNNPLLPTPEVGQAKALATSLARKHGFQVFNTTPSTVPVCNVEYNEVAYSQALNSVHSLTAFLTMFSPDGITVLATVMVSEDSGRTLESWSVLYEMFDKLFSALSTDLSKPDHK